MAAGLTTLMAPEQKESALQRWRTWMVQAYTQYGTRPAAQLADITSWLVFISLLAIVLEGVPGLAETYGSWFLFAETVVVLLFAIDYAANIILAKDRRAYLLGPWGIIDLLAIVPFFLTFARIVGDAGAARTLLALRALRVLRVLKLAKIAEEAAGEQGTGLAVEQHSVWRDMLLGLIVTCAVLALAEAIGSGHGHQVYWLAIGGGFSFSIAARRWCLRHNLSALSVLLILASLMAGAATAVLVDKDGDPSRANITALLTLAVVVVSGIWVEGRDGSL
ncbi:MAG: ion transporter [Chloroflexi bacterium]|nr:ion transporter [Chloroflexota bacterium]